MAYRLNRVPFPGTGHQSPRHRSHGERAERCGRIGWECWSRRDWIAGTVGWDIFDRDRKPVTHRKERRIARRELYAIAQEAEA